MILAINYEVFARRLRETHVRRNDLQLSMSLIYKYVDRSGFETKLPYDICHCDFPIPVRDRNFNKTLADINDARALEIKEKAHRLGKKILLRWSGGIDSTALVVAIIRNFTSYEYALVDVACNNYSIIENPVFYEKHIKPFFNIVDSSTLRNDDPALSNSFIVDGEPADLLFGSFVPTLYPNKAQLPLNEGNAISLIVKSISNEWTCDIPMSEKISFAEHFYSVAVGSALHCDNELNTVGDLWWWRMFNWMWQPNIYKHYTESNKILSAKAFTSWQGRYIPWHATDDYQQWSMNADSVTKFGSTVTEYKLPTRRYIASVFKNPWYLSFKGKQHSINYRTFDIRERVALKDDGTVLSCTKNLDEIKSLLFIAVTAVAQSRP